MGTNVRIFALILFSASFFVNSSLLAATIVSTTSGNFDAGSTWVGGTAPGSSDSAVILSGHTVTVVANGTVKSLCVYNATDATTALLRLNATYTLTVTDYVRAQSDDPSINPISRIDVRGTLTIGKDLYLKTDVDGLSTDAEVRMTTAGGIVELSGTIILEDGGGFLNASSAAATTFKMTGSSSKTLPVNTNLEFYSIIIDKSSGGTITLGAALAASDFFGDLTIENGNLANGGFSIAGVAGKDFTIKTGASLILSGSSVLPTNMDDFFNSGSIVQYTGTNNIGAGDQDFHNLALSGSGTKTLSAAITCNGNITISAGTLDAHATNNYSITVKGNWVNSGGTFQARSGAVTFSGSSNQQITSNGNSFYNVTIANTATQVSLNDNLTVTNLLTLTDGVITTSASYRVIVSSTSSTSIGGYSSGSFVNGNLRRNIASNTDTYVFPVGNGTGTANYYRADMINGSLTGITYIDSKFKALSGHSDSQMDVWDNWENGHLTYTTMNTAGVWELEPNAAPSAGTYSVKLYTANMSGLTDNNFGPLKRPVGSTTGADWSTGGGTLNNNDSDGRTVASGYMQRSGLTAFSEFGGGGGSSSGSGLPIELVSFNAEAKNGRVELEWTTATETNNDFFTIERSADGQNFETLATVKGAGNSMAMREYFAEDAHPFSGVSYYRLRQTDLDFTSAVVSDIVSVFVQPVQSVQPSRFTVMGNLINDGSVYIISKDSEPVQSSGSVSITDMSGRVVHRQKFETGGAQAFSVHLPAGLGSGIYFVIIEHSGWLSKHKVLFD